jgi:hypothetical protein
VGEKGNMGYFHGCGALGLLQGAAQFQADVAALMAVFQPYTPRPAAHLRELAEAAALLTLEHDQAAAASRALGTLPQQARRLFWPLSRLLLCELPPVTQSPIKYPV